MLRWLLLATVAAASTAVADGGSACTGGWGCGEMPSGVDEDECGIATKKPCAELATADVHAMLHLLGDMNGAVLFEGCDAIPQFARFTSALEKAALLREYGHLRTRLSHNVAQVWGPVDTDSVFDNVTLGEYIPEMEGFLPHHAFNAYDQNNAANVIVQEEGFLINSLGHNAELAAAAPTPPHRTVAMLQQFRQSILTLSPKGADMPFHQHFASWLYLAHGRKLWWISEPETSPPPELLWNDPVSTTSACRLSSLGCAVTPVALRCSGRCCGAGRRRLTTRAG